MSYFLKSKIVEDIKLKKEFIAKNRQYLGIDYPENYFDQGFIRAFFDEQNNMVGGYAVILEGPFRTISSTPQVVQDKIQNKRLFEVTGLWLSPHFKSGLPSVQFWLRCSKDICSQTQKDYLVYSYDLENKKLQQLYNLSKPIILYQGKVLQMPGMKGEAYESVQLAEPKVLKYLPIYAAPNFINKVLFGRKTFLKDVFSS